MKTVSRYYTKKQMRRKKFLKELHTYVKWLTFVVILMLAIQAIPIVLGLSSYYQAQYQMAPLPDKIEILKRGLAVKNGHTFITFNSYSAEMNGEAIISENYEDEQDKDECERMLKEWGIIGG